MESLMFYALLFMCPVTLTAKKLDKKDLLMNYDTHETTCDSIFVFLLIQFLFCGIFSLSYLMKGKFKYRFLKLLSCLTHVNRKATVVDASFLE